MTSKSKIRKRKSRHAGKQAAKTSPDTLVEQAREALAAGKFRDAIEAFKTLAKSEPPEVWIEGLADAYAGRAVDLEAKGMHKEALTLWENRAFYCPGVPPAPRHLALLLRMGRVQAALAGYEELLANGHSADVACARGHLAAAFLTDSDGFDRLRADDPVLRDGAPARAALEAYCSSDDDEAARQLEAIPFRSPYRDFALILKALLASADDANRSLGLLKRVATHSPFHTLAAAARLAMLPEWEFASQLAQAGPNTQAFAMALRGWPQRRCQLWRELMRDGREPDSSRLVTLLQRNNQALGADWARQKLRALAQAHLPGLPPRFTGAELPDRDRFLLAAMGAEAENLDLWTINTTWASFVDQIRAEHGRNDPPAGSDDALRIALVHRRCAGGKLPSLASPERQMAEQALEESLHLDPDYRPAYQQLIAHYRQTHRLQPARYWLDRALDRFPEDATLLHEALETALAGGTFKKAAGLAARILKQDPINRRAKASLFNAHIAHARKQVLKGRNDLAQRELEQADRWADGKPRQAQVALMRGLLRLPDDQAAAVATLREACEQLGGGLCGRLALALEAQRLNLTPKAVLKKARLLPPPQPDRSDLLACARLLREATDTNRARTPDAIAPLRGVFEKAAHSDELGYEDYTIVCESLRTAGEPALRCTFATAALKRWPGEPIFVLHQVEGKDARSVRLTVRDLHALETAFEQARESGDERTSQRLLQLLDELSPFGMGFMGELGSPPPAFPIGEPHTPPSEDVAEWLGAILASPGEVGDQLREIEETLGRDDLLRILEAAKGAGQLPPLPAQADDPPPRKGRKRSRDDGDNDPDQLDLF